MAKTITREKGRLYFCKDGDVMSVRTKKNGGGGRRVDASGAYTPEKGKMYFVNGDGSVGSRTMRRK